MGLAELKGVRVQSLTAGLRSQCRMTCSDVLGTAENSPMNERFWPITITKPEEEWNDFDRDYISFMRTAYAEGYRPRKGECDTIEVGDFEVGRSACLISRGRRNGWEPFLGDSDRSVKLGPSYCLPLGEYACVCVRPPFRSAAYLALEWMRGRSLASLLGDFTFVGGYPAGIALRADTIRPTVVAPGSGEKSNGQI